MSNFPTGTVTLLFTDIEGSTRLLLQLGDYYADVLAECRQLLRAVFQQWNGHEVDTQGDSFFVVFARAADAIAAVVAMQRALAAHAWPEGVAVRVRMGLHTGEPQLSAENYVGLDVHHAARIMSVGHGGQVLLSQTTSELVKQHLPGGVSVRDLGEHRLKDLQRSTHLYQLVMTGLPADFPPLKSLNNRPNNLPLQLTPLIGREQEVATALTFLQREQVRLLTLTGPGGTGKTRLALQVAAELSKTFSEGVYFVNLAPLSDPALVIPTIAQTLDLKESAGQSLLSLLKVSLHGKQVLLLLDNFEHVMDAAVSVAELLAACLLLKVLVTSRAALHLRGEQEFAVPPLAVPDPTHLPDLGTLAQYEAVALFLQRAQAVKPEFQVTNANAQAVAEICVRLDGLPLAIELAAARIKVLPPQALLSRLDQRLAVLTGGARDAPARQQTLRNTIAWSYQLLNASEQRLFQRLSVFAGGCTLEAIEAVCTAFDADTASGEVLEGVASLVDKSLLQQTEQEGDDPRLLMLETIREYGLECLTATGEAEATRQAHAAYYLQLAERAEPELRGTQQALWLERLEREYENLRAAMECFLERAGTREGKEQGEPALRLCVALAFFWRMGGYLREGRAWLSRALAASEEVVSSLRARGLFYAGVLAHYQDSNEQAEVLCGESLALYRELGDTGGMAISLDVMGDIAWRKGDYATAHPLFEEAETLFKEASDTWERADVLGSLVRLFTAQGEYSRARELGEECLALYIADGDQQRIGWCLQLLAWVHFLSQGDQAKARALAEESLVLLQEAGSKEFLAYVLGLLAQMHLLQGEQILARELAEESVATLKEVGSRFFLAQSLVYLARVVFFQSDDVAARALYEESLTVAGEIGARQLIASGLEGLADVVAAQRMPAWAALLWGAAEALRDTIGTPLPPVYRADYERSVSAARAQLGEKAFAAAWAEGRTMTPDQALAARGQALGSSSSSIGERMSGAPSTSTVPYPDGLTSREVEVLRLVAQGLTDAQIAEQLIISPRTVNSHLTSIYGKVGVSSRSAATRYAIEYPLV
jgi:predicted ATPase/class 3 adenylate cyclase/DNA-binding CsgD family transcriptional regulator